MDFCGVGWRNGAIWDHLTGEPSPSRLGSMDNRAWWCSWPADVRWPNATVGSPSGPGRKLNRFESQQKAQLCGQVCSQSCRSIMYLPSYTSLPGISYLLGFILLFRLYYDFDWIVVWHAFIRLLQIQWLSGLKDNSCGVNWVSPWSLGVKRREVILQNRNQLNLTSHAHFTFYKQIQARFKLIRAIPLVQFGYARCLLETFHIKAWRRMC